jgi:phage terminase Nu1 subunit (DNA packaging protein)
MAKALTQAALALALDLTEGRVSQLKSQGMPVDSVEAAQAWRNAQQNIAARKPAPAAVEAAAQHPAELASFAMPSTPQTFPPLGAFADEDFQAARTRREIAEANLAELKEAEQNGKVIQTDAVRAAWSRRVAGTRDALLQIPSRLAPVLAAEQSMERIALLLEAELRQALHELSRDGGISTQTTTEVTP